MRRALEERGNVAGTAQDADDVDAAPGRAVEDDVLPDGKAAEVWSKLGAKAAHGGVAGEEIELFHGRTIQRS